MSYKYNSILKSLAVAGIATALMFGVSVIGLRGVPYALATGNSDSDSGSDPEQNIRTISSFFGKIDGAVIALVRLMGQARNEYRANGRQISTALRVLSEMKDKPDQYTDSMLRDVSGVIDELNERQNELRADYHDAKEAIKVYAKHYTSGLAKDKSVKNKDKNYSLIGNLVREVDKLF